MIGYHERIKRQFGRSASGPYDSNVRVQPIMAVELVERVQERCTRGNPPHLDLVPPHVLEIGCGTGTLTALLAHMPLLRHAQITAIDISSSMLESAERKLNEACPEAISRIRWVEADAEQWSAARTRPHSQACSPDAPYALIVSNACFQWFAQPARTLAALRGLLCQGGLLAFTTFGPRTMHELHASFQRAYQRIGQPYRHRGLSFHSLAEWRDMLQGAGLRLLEASSHEHIETHRSVPDFLHAVKAIGASAGNAQAGGSADERGARRQLFREMFRVYASQFPAPSGVGIAATYETLTIVVTRD